MTALNSAELLWMEISKLLRARFHKDYPFSSDGEVSPLVLELRDAIYCFPLVVRSVLLDIEGKANPFGSESMWTLLRFVLNRTDEQPNDFGVVRLTEFLGNPSLLAQFEQADDESKRSLEQLTYIGSWNGEEGWFIQFVPYDIRANTGRYVEDLYRYLMENSLDLQQRFSRRIDFMALYDLSPDPILSDAELLQPEERTKHFWNMEANRHINLEDLQRSVADIQLTPSVPEDVVRTFSLAKRMYVFGYFEYLFFTASMHYAYLALDSAFHARWTSTLGDNVAVEVRKKNRTEHSEVLAFTSHTGLRQWSKVNGWRVENLWVKGERFPHTVGQVLDSLHTKGIVSRWQARHFKETAVELRNSLTHLEAAPIVLPSSDLLRRVAYDINALFHNPKP